MTALLDRHRGLIALAARETDRVLKLWSQTIAAPVLASFLFILVFGLSLGGRIRQIDGVEYDVFIVPGLIAMAMAQAAYSNNSSSVFQSRSDRYINDVLSAPMRSWEVNLGLSIGGIVRSLSIGSRRCSCSPSRSPTSGARARRARVRGAHPARAVRAPSASSSGSTPRRGTRRASSTTS